WLPPAEREARRVHAGPLGGEEMPELVYEDHEPEDQQRGEPTQHQRYSCTSARAAASAASSAVLSSPGRPPRRDSAVSMAAGILLKGSDPSSTRATAASLAALNTAGATPPARP